MLINVDNDSTTNLRAVLYIVLISAFTTVFILPALLVYHFCVLLVQDGEAFGL